MKLNPRQRRFAQEYLIDLNSAQAAIRAGYSKKTARTIGSKLLTHIDVKKLVNDGMAKRSQKTGLTAERVLANIIRIADNAEDSGDFGAALKGNELLGKHLKLFTDVVQATVAVNPLEGVATETLVAFVQSKK